MKNLFKKLGEALRKGEDAVLVTVIACSGSTPRGTGARMLVTGKGRIFGTIGGGVLEYESELIAGEVLKTGNSRKENYRLHENDIQDIGMICGGDVDVYFLFIKAGDAAAIAITEHIESLIMRGEQLWLIFEVMPGHGGVMSVYGRKSGLIGNHIPEPVIKQLTGKVGLVFCEGREYYCENIGNAGIVYIFGGGHVTQALVPVLASVDFRCVVLEDRDELCREELFPGVEKVEVIDNGNIFDSVSITDDDFIVIMTRGHKYDQIILSQVLNTPACYIGVIGSKRKADKVADNLRKAGHTDENLARVYSPVGLDIEAETPAEIAVSIASQMIMVRSGLKI